MNATRYKVAEHLLEVRFPASLSSTDIIPSFSPFVCEEEGDVLFDMEWKVFHPPGRLEHYVYGFSIDRIPV